MSDRGKRGASERAFIDRVERLDSDALNAFPSDDVLAVREPGRNYVRSTRPGNRSPAREGFSDEAAGNEAGAAGRASRGAAERLPLKSHDLSFGRRGERR